MVKDKRHWWEKYLSFDSLCPYCEEYSTVLESAGCDNCYLLWAIKDKTINTEYLQLQDCKKLGMVTADEFIRIRDMMVAKDKALDTTDMSTELVNIKKKYGG